MPGTIKLKASPQMSSDKIKAFDSIPKRFRSAFEIKLIFDLTAKHVDVFTVRLYIFFRRIKRILLKALMAGFRPSRKLSDKSDRNTRADQTNVYSMNEIGERGKISSLNDGCAHLIKSQ